MQRKLILLCVLTAFIILAANPVAFATGDVLLDSENFTNIMQGKIPSQNDEEPEESGNWIEKILSLPIQGIANVLFDFVGLKGLDKLIFNAGESASMVIPPFINDEAWAKVEKWFTGFQVASAGLIFLAIIIAGIKITASAFNVRKRHEEMAGLMRWVYALMIIAGAPMIINLLIQANNYAVSLCYNLAVSMGALEPSLLERWGDGILAGVRTGNVLATSIITLAMAVLAMYFNVLYVIRSFVLVGLYALTPILVWLWAINNNEDAIKVWFGEITSVCFMQFSHAFALCFFFSVINPIREGAGASWITIVGLMAIIPFSAMIRNIFQGFWRYLGVNEEAVAGRGLGMIGGALALTKMSASKNLGVNISGAPSGSGKTQAGLYGVSQEPGSSFTISGTMPLAEKTANILGGNAAGAQSYLGKAAATAIKGVGIVGGIAAGAVLAPVSPALAFAAYRGTQGVISMAGRAAGMGAVVGGSVLLNTMGLNQSGTRMGLGQAINEAATIKVTSNSPQGTLPFEGMDRIAPESTKDAVAQLVGGTTSKVIGNQGTIQGMSAGSRILEEQQQLVNTVQGSRQYKALKDAINNNVQGIDNLYRYR